MISPLFSLSLQEERTCEKIPKKKNQKTMVGKLKSFWLQNTPSPKSQGICMSTRIEIANICGVTGYHLASYDYHLNRQTKEKKLLSNSEGRRVGALCLMFWLNREPSQPASSRKAPVCKTARISRHITCQGISPGFSLLCHA